MARADGVRRAPFLGPDGAFTAALSALVAVGSFGLTVLLAFRVWRGADVGGAVEVPAKPAREPVAAA